MRNHLKSNASSKTNFQLRGLDNTRIEALSDGVFALSIALLLITSDVPETFQELKLFLGNFFPFAGTISILMIVWYQHYIFFVRYGLKDAGIVGLNTVLLFLILFFVYPLKFLFQVLFDLFSGIVTSDGEALNHLFTVIIPAKESPNLMIIYGLGLMLVFLTMTLMYYVALRKKEKLELSESEQFDTRSNIYSNLLMATLPFISASISFFEIGGGGPDTFQISGMIYMLYSVFMPVFGALRSKKRKKQFA